MRECKKLEYNERDWARKESKRVHNLPPSGPGPANGICAKLSCGPKSGIGNEEEGSPALALRALRCEAAGLGFIDRGPRTLLARGLLLRGLRKGNDDGEGLTSVSVEGREIESDSGEPSMETSDQEESDHRRALGGCVCGGGGDERNIPGGDDVW
jgi:hypothetical protein